MKLISLSELTQLQTPLMLAQRNADDTIQWWNVQSEISAIQLDDFNKLLNDSHRPTSIFYLRAVIIQNAEEPEEVLNSIAGICIYRKDGKGAVEFTPQSIGAQDDNWVEFFRVEGDNGYVPDTLIMDGLENSKHHRELLMDLYRRSQQLQ